MTFSDLEQSLLTFYCNKGRRSLRHAECAINHLRETFGASRATAITAERISDYETQRLEAGAPRATVMYELATPRRVFSLAVKAGKLSSRPAISTPKVKNERTGFFEPDDFAAVMKQLSPVLQVVMTFAYHTGLRVRSEILPAELGLRRLRERRCSSRPQNDEDRRWPDLPRTGGTA
jgi:hypothetical protein